VRYKKQVGFENEDNINLQNFGRTIYNFVVIHFISAMVDNEESVYSANIREGPYFLPHLP